MILALSEEPRSTTAWAVGGYGEEVIGQSLDRLRAEGLVVLHDRRIPGTRANIDHIVVSPAGVFVIDTKSYAGRVEQRDLGGWFRTDLRLYVGGRDRTKLVSGMQQQVGAIRKTLLEHEEWRDVPVTPAILFMREDNWPLLSFRPLRFGDVYVLWGKALGKLVRAEGTIPLERLSHLERRLAAALPSR